MPHRPDTWTEALFIYLFSIPCQFLDFIHGMVSIFFFNGVTVKTENTKNSTLDLSIIATLMDF